MERYSMFLVRKNQYCENDYTTKSIYRFNEIPIKLPMAFFYRISPLKKLQNLYRNTKDHTILRKKSKTRGIMLSDFNLYYNNQNMLLHKYTYADQ